MTEENTGEVVRDKVQLGYPPVIQAIQVEKGIFTDPSNRYQLYRHLVDTDDTLWGGIHTSAVLVQKCLQGFIVKAGKQLDETEKRLKEELDTLYNNLLKKYVYDIAWKMVLDGTVVYALDLNNGLTDLHYLPMPYLTCVETDNQVAKLEYLSAMGVPKKIIQRKKKRIKMEEVRKWLLTSQILKRGIFILNELDEDKRQTWPADDCVVFDWGKREMVKDLLGRFTLNVWNKSPLRSLTAKILWKHSLIIGDMQFRRKYYPREHHKLKAEMFDPSNFEGTTYELRVQKANAAALSYLQKYAKQIMQPDTGKTQEPDQGYVTFDDVEILMIESKVPYTDPNKLLDQIDQAVPAVTGVPSSAITGAGQGRASYASELQIGHYLALKAEFIASRVADMFIEIAQKHILNKHENTTDDEFKKLNLIEHLNKIRFKLTKILERHQLVRDAAILSELPFTDNELRDVLDYPPLTNAERKEINERRLITSRKHTESGKEISSTGRKLIEDDRRPLTPPSKEQQQLT